jgi:hypothetical protein
MNSISIDAFKTAITNIDDLYDAVLRNGYYLPKLKSSMRTETYLTGVMSKDIHCPLTKDIRLLNCPAPPTKAVLINKLKNIEVA